MALKNIVLRIILAFTCFIDSGTATSRNIVNLHIKPGSNLQVRLETSGGLAECWIALMELKSCTNEIVLFFLNGQANIGPDCCRTIGIITHNCWPAMLTSLGFTAEEGNILRGYCDVSPAPVSASPPEIYQPRFSAK